MKRLTFVLLTATVLLTLPGCWDTDKLADKLIINGIALDVADHGRILGTASTIKLINKGGGQFEEQDDVVQATGASVTEIGSMINNMMPGKIESSKTHIIMVGEKLAKAGVLSSIETFYRNSKGNLNSSFLIAKGRASDMLEVANAPTGSPIAFEIEQMIKGAQFAAIAPNQTLYTIWTELLDSESDIIIPLISKRSDHIVIESIALMNDDKYSGVTMDQKDSKLLMLMTGNFSRTTLLNIPLEKLSTILTYEVTKASNKIEVTVDDLTGRIDCVIHVKLYGDILSYPMMGDANAHLSMLSAAVEEALEKQVQRITKKLQTAHCDALGIGRHFRITHPKLWENVEWDSVYPEVRISSQFKVNFESTGLLR
ncbi:Ger(x)C family spore germination protein [Paenibacillus sp. strain BS8-2]